MPEPGETLIEREVRLAAAMRRGPEGAREQPEYAIARLLVTKLRFQRLLRGSPRARLWYERDPAAFTAAFRAYCAEVPARSPDSRAEALAFGDWVESESRP